MRFIYKKNQSQGNRHIFQIEEGANDLLSVWTAEFVNSAFMDQSSTMLIYVYEFGGNRYVRFLGLTYDEQQKLKYYSEDPTDSNLEILVREISKRNNLMNKQNILDFIAYLQARQGIQNLSAAHNDVQFDEGRKHSLTNYPPIEQLVSKSDWEKILLNVAQRLSIEKANYPMRIPKSDTMPRAVELIKDSSGEIRIVVMTGHKKNVGASKFGKDRLTEQDNNSGVKNVRTCYVSKRQSDGSYKMIPYVAGKMKKAAADTKLDLQRQCALYNYLGVDAFVGPEYIKDGKRKISIFTPLYDKGTLRDFMRNKKNMTDVNIKSVMQDILEQIDKLHAIGLAHNDLKPDNILVYQQNGRWRAQIVDLDTVTPLFGSSNSGLTPEQQQVYNLFKDKKRTKKYAGTGYASPQFYRNFAVKPNIEEEHHHNLDLGYLYSKDSRNTYTNVTPDNQPYLPEAREDIWSIMIMYQEMLQLSSPTLTEQEYTRLATVGPLGLDVNFFHGMLQKCKSTYDFRKNIGPAAMAEEKSGVKPGKEQSGPASPKVHVEITSETTTGSTGRTLEQVDKDAYKNPYISVYKYYEGINQASADNSLYQLEIDNSKMTMSATNTRTNHSIAIAPGEDDTTVRIEHSGSIDMWKGAFVAIAASNDKKASFSINYDHQNIALAFVYAIAEELHTGLGVDSFVFSFDNEETELAIRNAVADFKGQRAEEIRDMFKIELVGDTIKILDGSPFKSPDAPKFLSTSHRYRI